MAFATSRKVTIRDGKARISCFTYTNDGTGGTVNVGHTYDQFCMSNYEHGQETEMNKCTRTAWSGNAIPGGSKVVLLTNASAAGCFKAIDHA